MTMTIQRRVILVLPESPRRERIINGLSDQQLHVECHHSADQCLHNLRRNNQRGCYCIVAELHGIGMFGLDLQREIAALPHASSFVFCTSRAEPCEIVQAMRQGAIAVVELHDDLQQLTEFILEGIDCSEAQFRCECRCQETLDRLARLSFGECQVLEGILAGKLNKEMARMFNLSIRTIEQRRREVFRKMNVQHPASLTRKVIEVAQMSRLELGSDDQIEWLSRIRRDLGQSIVPPRTSLRMRVNC